MYAGEFRVGLLEHHASSVAHSESKVDITPHHPVVAELLKHARAVIARKSFVQRGLLLTDDVIDDCQKRGKAFASGQPMFGRGMTVRSEALHDVVCNGGSRLDLTNVERFKEALHVRFDLLTFELQQRGIRYDLARQHLVLAKHYMHCELRRPCPVKGSGRTDRLSRKREAPVHPVEEGEVPAMSFSFRREELRNSKPQSP